MTKIIEKDGRIWRQYANAKRYVVLCNKNGELQAQKVCQEDLTLFLFYVKDLVMLGF